MKHSKSEEAIFCEALEIPVDQRRQYLQSVCDGDPELLAAVEGLLQIHDTEEDFLATPAIGLTTVAINEEPGDQIGCYVLQRKIGEGGFGIVWLAQQLEPIKRQVALKVVKLGMDSATIIRRFDDERQTLALMNHPNIATVLDAGVTDGGRPYFAMELVDGCAIDQYCLENKLSNDGKLAAFAIVCRAVQHAHHKGIVHRDLKPSNILIANDDGQILPKVIDFGIATAVRSERTETGEVNSPLVGTPQYMSPEQWRNEADIDTRSDIYSLGVVLYRLLAGSLPQVESPTELPEFPRLSQVHKNDLLTATIHEDLDWIVAKATSPDRDDRYPSASELAIDIERYLRGEAVLAHPGGVGYQLQKFIARNKFAVGSSVLTMFALLAGICASTWGMIYANQQRTIADQQKQAAQDNEKEAIRLKEIAEAEARKLRVVANVLKNMLPEANPFRGMKSGFQIREHLDELINSVDTLSNEPEMEADLRITAARVYENIERYGRARLQYFKAREIREQKLGANHPRTMLCLTGMAACNIELGRLEAAEKMIQEVIDSSSDGRAPRNHINALRTLRRIRDQQQNFTQAFEIAEQVRELSRDFHKGEIFGRIHVANEYAISAMKVGLHEEAESVVRQSLKVLERDHPERKFVIANTKHRLAEILLESKKFGQAKQLAREYIEMQIQTLGENDSYVIRGKVLLSEIHRRDDDLLVAEQIALDAVAQAESLETDQIKWRRASHRQLAKILARLDLNRAADAWETAIRYSWQLLGGDVSVAKDLLRQAAIFEKLERFTAAKDRVLRAIEILEHRKGTGDQMEEANEMLKRLSKSSD